MRIAVYVLSVVALLLVVVAVWQQQSIAFLRASIDQIKAESSLSVTPDELVSWLATEGASLVPDERGPSASFPSGLAVRADASEGRLSFVMCAGSLSDSEEVKDLLAVSSFIVPEWDDPERVTWLLETAVLATKHANQSISRTHGNVRVSVSFVDFGSNIGTPVITFVRD